MKRFTTRAQRWKKHLVAKLNGAAQAAVCRAVLDAVELACLALSRLGFEGAVGLLANVSTVIKQKVVAVDDGSRGGVVCFERCKGVERKTGKKCALCQYFW